MKTKIVVPVVILAVAFLVRCLAIGADNSIFSGFGTSVEKELTRCRWSSWSATVVWARF